MTGTTGISTALKGLETRVRDEYLEMPGQRLTTEQASRLWGVDERVSEVVLDRLVEARFLKHVGPYYFRADLGRSSD